MDHGLHGMDMGGMDMGSASMFQTTNIQIAKLFWYFVAAVVALCVIKRGCDSLRTVHAKRTSDQRTHVPSRPTNVISQGYETIITLSRETAYPQFRPFTGSFSRYFSTPALGQTLFILAYWTMILIMLWSNVILDPSSDIYGYKWEIVGYRAAWVSITQLPLIYCLGGKANIISLLTGISYERLNWLHRWVARTIFLTVIVHWSYFFREWWLADFIQDEFDMMPMIKYGFGAWSVIGWSVVTGFGFFRTKWYELWILQHLATAGLILWLLYIHVPVYAQYNIWLSVAFVAFDRSVRGIWSLARNLHASRLWRKISSNRSVIGFHAKVECHDDGYVSILVENTDFSWQPGQHVFISMPSCGILESHPFTITNLPDDQTNSLRLYLKCHSGFTGRLRRKIMCNKANKIVTFVSGPWGNPPVAKIERCNSLIFVASSTGAGFTVPLLEHAIQKAKFVQRISFLWIVRHESQLEIFMPRIVAAMEAARQLSINAEARMFITNGPSSLTSSQSSIGEKIIPDQKEQSNSSFTNESSEDSILPVKESLPLSDEKSDVPVTYITTTTSQQPSVKSGGFSEFRDRTSPSISFSQGRPQSWDNLFHPTIVEAEGETAVIACGGRALMADIRNYVAWISDQRAVHKGTGAQGISLYTETYGW